MKQIKVGDHVYMPRSKAQNTSGKGHEGAIVEAVYDGKMEEFATEPNADIRYDAKDLGKENVPIRWLKRRITLQHMKENDRSAKENR